MDTESQHLPDGCSSDELLEYVENMLASGEFEWATKMLESIYDLIERSQSHTEGQEQAIRNIAKARGW
jgi:hypothetical protein